MFDRFAQTYTLDGTAPDAQPPGPDLLELDAEAPGIAALFERWSGASFGGGIYRVHRAQDVARWTENLVAAFPAWRGRIVPFGYCWQGRHFAVLTGARAPDDGPLLLLDPTHGQAYHIPVGVEAFHNEELVDWADASLKATFYAAWRRRGGGAPAHADCVGWTRLPSLGGEDSLDNLSVGDMDVYWHMCAQL